MPSKEDITTIQISKATRDELKKLGKKGETYDAIIRQLLNLRHPNLKENVKSSEKDIQAEGH